MLHGARKNDRQIEARYVKINFLRTIFEMALAPFHFEIFNSLKFNEIMDVGKLYITRPDSEPGCIRMNI
jgi:hypothetical protein